MQSKFVLLATTLALLITTPPTFADDTPRNNVKADNVVKRAVVSPTKEDRHPDEKVEATGARFMPENQFKLDSYQDPCLIDKNISGCGSTTK